MQGVTPCLSETYAAEPASVPIARGRLAEFATASGAARDLVESVRLGSSEALTNAALHAYRGDRGQIYVTAAVVSDELWVLIGDDGCGLEPRADRPGLGLGLGLIAQVSDDLAIVTRAGGGVEVRMSFALNRAEHADDHTGTEPAAQIPQPSGSRGPQSVARGAQTAHDRGSSPSACRPASSSFSTTT